MSLREPVPVVPADELGRVHVMAVGGVSMSGLAEMLARRGLAVSGCDRGDSAVLARLRAAGVSTQLGHDPAHLDGVDTVIASSAIGPANPELAAAGERGLRVLHRSAALAALLHGHDVIGISGTHGKTTTSAMTVQALLDRDPSYHIGSTLAATGRGADEGTGAEYVIEADESDGSFLQYDCRIVAVTNIEADHLDNWETPARYADGFYAFATRPAVEHVVACADDPGSRALIERLRREGRSVTSYGLAPDADVRCDELGLQLQVPGEHNLRNATCAFVIARLVGVPDDVARRRLGEFRGTARRFQAVASVGGVDIVDDYAHHPTEIAAALDAARATAGDRRVIALFQPHLFTRTRDFAAEFGRALGAADVVVLTDIYPAREEPLPGITGETVVAAVPDSVAVSYVPDLADVPAHLAALVRPGDLVLTLGAGDVTTVGPALAALLEQR